MLVNVAKQSLDQLQLLLSAISTKLNWQSFSLASLPKVMSNKSESNQFIFVKCTFLIIKLGRWQIHMVWCFTRKTALCISVHYNCFSKLYTTHIDHTNYLHIIWVELLCCMRASMVDFVSCAVTEWTLLFCIFMSERSTSNLAIVATVKCYFFTLLKLK